MLDFQSDTTLHAYVWFQSLNKVLLVVERLLQESASEDSVSETWACCATPLRKALALAAGLILSALA